MASIEARSTGRTDPDGHGAYDLDVRLRISGDRLLLAPTLEADQSTAFGLDSPALVGPDTDHVHVTAFGDRRWVELGDTIREDPTVEDAVLVASFRRELLFRVVPSTVARQFVVPFADVDAVIRHTQGRDGYWNVRAYLPSRAELASVVANFREQGIAFELERLSTLRAVEDPETPTLTESQRELLAVAADRGYFETPRGVSQRELAAAFDVSPSAMSQRLRNATGDVVEQVLSTHCSAGTRERTPGRHLDSLS
jgi:predicted DNA binding protein